MPLNTRRTRYGPVLDFTLERVVREHVELTLQYTGGHIGWAARELKMNRTTLHRWIKRWRRGERRKKGAL